MYSASCNAFIALGRRVPQMGLDAIAGDKTRLEPSGCPNYGAEPTDTVNCKNAALMSGSIE